MSRTPEQRRRDEPRVKLVAMPISVGEKLSGFCLDRKTGNVLLNIRDGEILKAQLTEFVGASD